MAGIVLSTMDVSVLTIISSGRRIPERMARGGKGRALWPPSMIRSFIFNIIFLYFSFPSTISLSFFSLKVSIDIHIRRELRHRPARYGDDDNERTASLVQRVSFSYTTGGVLNLFLLLVSIYCLHTRTCFLHFSCFVAGRTDGWIKGLGLGGRLCCFENLSVYLYIRWDGE